MENQKAWIPHGLAVKAYWEGDKKAKIKIKMDDGESVEMPAKIYFRQSDKMPEIEKIALDLCEGRILDVGAGAGAHALMLRDYGHEPIAMDIDPNCIQVMEERGLEDLVCADFLKYQSKIKYDTLLFLMNGIGIAGNLDGLQAYLKHAYNLTQNKGQLILDSSDLSISNPELEIHENGTVYYQLSFDGITGERYPWLYIDFDTLHEEAAKAGWEAEMIYENEDGSYLACLKKAAKV